MSDERKKRLSAMFGGVNPEELSAAANGAEQAPRVASGSVKSMKDSFSGIEKENEDLRRQLNNSSNILELDPNLIDVAPITDRFDDLDQSALNTLKASIREHGQEVPVLVRPHPEQSGRWQLAYGHRRLRALKSLGIKAKAVVKSLTDEELVVAQGLENSARENLSWIERAMFAHKLEQEDFARKIVQDALSIDRAEASKLIRVASTIPTHLIEAIGRAPNIGRGRWLVLSQKVEDVSFVKKATTLFKEAEFKELTSDERFEAVLSADNIKPARQQPQIINHGSAAIAKILRKRNDVSIAIDTKRNSEFAEFLIEKLPQLFVDFEKTK